MIASKLTEEQIERRVERITDSLDRQLMNNSLTQEEYDAEIKHLDQWANEQYDK